jgi:hypothetical protein
MFTPCALKIDAAGSSETLVFAYETTSQRNVILIRSDKTTFHFYILLLIFASNLILPDYISIRCVLFSVVALCASYVISSLRE